MCKFAVPSMVAGPELFLTQVFEAAPLAGGEAGTNEFPSPLRFQVMAVLKFSVNRTCANSPFKKNRLEFQKKKTRKDRYSSLITNDYFNFLPEFEIIAR
jgi:hypothetical protein